MYRLLINVKEQVRGICPVHKVGEKFIVDEGYIIHPGKLEKLCVYALAGMMPLFAALSKDLPEEDPMSTKIQHYQCFDPHNTVLFEIKREKTG